MRSRLVFVALFGALAACGHGPPSKAKGAPSVPPDESYQVGATGYERGYIWHCNGGSRVHVSSSCGELVGCSGWRIERGPCGTPLAGEPAPSAREPMEIEPWK